MKKPHITKTKEGWDCTGGPWLKYTGSGNTPELAYTNWVKLINFVNYIKKREASRGWQEL